MSTYFEAATGPIVAADFHYFRLPREKWELMLTRLRQMGLNTLILTLPWGFHEVEPGMIDLTGTTNSRRDLVSLMQCCAAMNFVCLLKPGPYTAAGVLGQGLPMWLLKQTNDLSTALPQAVTGWFKALSQMLTGQQWPNGPIIALHVEGESDQGQAQPLSPQFTEVKWPIWLRKHYDGIEALNAAYGTAHRSVNEVKFPEDRAAVVTPLAKDAQAFLESIRHDTQAGYRNLLADSGWQVPIYLSLAEINPPWQNLSLTNPNDLAALTKVQKKSAEPRFLNLQQPIQIDPDPVDIGRGPVWAAGAPIRADGSLRPAFWQVRQYLWSQAWPDTQSDDKTLVSSFAHSSLITRDSAALIKIDLPASIKAKPYRLRLTGELIAEADLKLSRGKLSGLYQAEDNTSQTDLLLVLNEAAAPLCDFPLLYLSALLAAQTQVLTRSAALATALGETLSPGLTNSAGVAPERPSASSYTLEQARRGLREADAALRKALASISKLEGGFATILDKETPQPVAPPVAINPAIFEDQVRDVLIELGTACAKIAPTLKSAAEILQHTLASPAGFTVEQYQQSYAAVIMAARAAEEPLLEIIALLRVEIAAERLPLVVWRAHDQVQEIAESLRWGVLRG